MVYYLRMMYIRRIKNKRNNTELKLFIWTIKMVKDFEERKSKWLRDLIRFLPLKSQFVLSGNVRDLQIEDKESGAVVRSLTSCLNGELRAYGYSQVLCYDSVNGFKSIDPVTGQQSYEAAENLMKQLGIV
jgi:hypothetical protein